MIDKQLYQLDLWKPSGEYAGKLNVYNLNVKLDLKSFSSITFDIASYLDDKLNERVFDVFDNYEVDLEYMDQTHRFILNSLPSKFNDKGISFSYEGLTTDSELDKKIITGWRGARRTISYFKDIIKDGPLTLTEGNYDILESVRKAYDVPLDEIIDYIEVIEVREKDGVVRKTPLTQMEKTSSFFRRGTYEAREHSLNQNWTTVEIAPFSKSDILFNPEESDPSKHEFILSDELKISYEIYIKPPFEAIEDGEEGKYLISDAALKEGKIISESGGYIIKEYYSTVGIQIEELLLDILPKTWDFTFEGEEYSTSNSELRKIKRSDIKTENSTIYSILQEISKIFDVVYFIDSKNRVIDFYKEYKDKHSSVMNNIILGEGHYLKSLDKSLDTKSIATNIYGIGKNYITTGTYSPTGASWFDYSYYLDEYWKYYKELWQSVIRFYLTKEELTVLKRPDEYKIQSRWMTDNLAEKVASKQIIRDFITDIYLGKQEALDYLLIIEGEEELTQFGIDLKNSFDLIRRKQKAMEELAKVESRFIEEKAKANNYEILFKQAGLKRNIVRESGWMKINSNEYNPGDTNAIFLKGFHVQDSINYLNSTFGSPDYMEYYAMSEREYIVKIGNSKAAHEIYESYDDRYKVYVSDPKNHQLVFNKFKYSWPNIDLSDIGIRAINRDTGYEYYYRGGKFSSAMYYYYTPIIYEENHFNKDYEKYYNLYQMARHSMSILEPQVYDLDTKLFRIDYSDGEDLQIAEEDRYGYLLYKNRENLNGFVPLTENEQEELEKFTFDYVLQDNTVSNSHDLFEKVIKYAAENAKPKISLKVNIIDILAAADISEEERNNLKLGDYVYVNFPQFNIDERAQIQSLSINFDSNSVSLDITTAEEYETSLLFKMVDGIRDSKELGKGVRYKEDSTNRTQDNVIEIKDDLNRGDIWVQDGAGTEMGQGGIITGEVEIDHDFEVLKVKNTDTNDVFTIIGGGLFYQKESTPRYIYNEGTNEYEPTTKLEGTQILLTLEDYFKINKYTENLQTGEKEITNIFWIDESGNIRIRDGVISIGQGEGKEGFDKDGIFIGEEKLSLKGNGGHFKWNGNSLELSGKVTATSGSIGSWNLDNNKLKSDDGSIFLDGDQKADYVIKAGDNFTVSPKGSIKAKDGEIGGWLIKDSYLKAGSGDDSVHLYGNGDSDIAIMIGHEDNWDYSTFGVKKDGTVRITVKGEKRNVSQLVNDFDESGDQILKFDGHLITKSGQIAKWEILEDRIQSVYRDSKYVGLKSGEYAGLLVKRAVHYDQTDENEVAESGIFIGEGVVLDNLNEENTWKPYNREVLSIKSSTSTDELLWDGRNLRVKGNVTANRGTIGGWSLTGNRLYNEKNTYKELAILPDDSGELTYSYKDYDFYYLDIILGENLLFSGGKFVYKDHYSIELYNEENEDALSYIIDGNTITVDKANKIIGFITDTENPIKLIISYNRNMYVGMHSYNYGGNIVVGETTIREAFLAGGADWNSAKFGVDFDGNFKLATDGDNYLNFSKKGLDIGGTLTTKNFIADNEKVQIGVKEAEKDSIVLNDDGQLDITIDGRDLRLLLKALVDLLGDYYYWKLIDKQLDKPEGDILISLPEDISDPTIQVGAEYWIKETESDIETYTLDETIDDNYLRERGWITFGSNRATWTLIRTYEGIGFLLEDPGHGGGPSPANPWPDRAVTYYVYRVTGPRLFYKQYKKANK